MKHFSYFYFENFKIRDMWLPRSQYSPVQFSRSVVSNSLRPHGLQPTRLLRPWDFSRPRVLEWGAIAFSIPRSKRLLISWLQSPSAVILEPKKIKSDIVSPSNSHEVMGPDAMI